MANRKTQAGKGDKQRPTDAKRFGDGYDTAFPEKKKKEPIVKKDKKKAGGMLPWIKV